MNISNPSPEEKRIAIAERLPWPQPNYCSSKIWFKIDGVYQEVDPLSSLDACAEMEKVLTEEQQYDYSRELEGVTNAKCDEYGPTTLGVFTIATATASHRCDAFLSVI